MANGTSSQEAIGLRRVAALPGVEILDAEHTDRIWRIFNLGFGIAVPTTWQGDVLYRRRQLNVPPGTVFCTMPGEVHTTPRIDHKGSFNVLIVQPSVLREYLADRNQRSLNPEWHNIVARASPRLREGLARLFSAVSPAHSAMEQQSALLTLIDIAAEELMDGSPRRPFSDADAVIAAKRLRECLHSPEGARMDLHTLGRAVSMNRFQVLRSFRRRYGLPPHAYQLCVRIGLARQMLIDGLNVTQASAECGFADSSHLARHFKRALGVSPKQYARTSSGEPAFRPPHRSATVGDDWIAATLARSDALACPDFRAVFARSPVSSSGRNG